MSQPSRQARYRIGIDIGGTFTDVVSVDTASGAIAVTKVASTPSNPGIALVRGVRAILAQSRRNAPRRRRHGARNDGRNECAAARVHIIARSDRHRGLPACPKKGASISSD